MGRVPVCSYYMNLEFEEKIRHRASILEGLSRQHLKTWIGVKRVECIEEGSQGLHTQQAELCHFDGGFAGKHGATRGLACRYFPTVNLYFKTSVTNKQRKVLNGLSHAWTVAFSITKDQMTNVFSNVP